MFSFLTNSFLLGIGLAMDAFSVSVANGLAYPKMKSSMKFKISFIFAFFQFGMPIIGWSLVTRLTVLFTKISRFIPWISFGLLLFIGGKMIVEAVMEIVKNNKAGDKTENENKESDADNSSAEDAEKKLTLVALISQGIATSLDALSTGFTIAEYNIYYAFLCAGIIAVVTFALCLIGVILGKKIGEKISAVASIFGGCILILIGIKILLGF